MFGGNYFGGVYFGQNYQLVAVVPPIPPIPPIPPVPPVPGGGGVTLPGVGGHGKRKRGDRLQTLNDLFPPDYTRRSRPPKTKHSRKTVIVGREDVQPESTDIDMMKTVMVLTSWLDRQ